MGAVKFVVGVSFLFSLSAIAVTNGVFDDAHLSVVRLVNESENSLCSGVVIGADPVTVVSALHCTMSQEPFSKLYVDLRGTAREKAEISKNFSGLTLEGISQKDLNFFKSIGPINLGNGSGIDPSKMNSNSVIHLGDLNFPLDKKWQATKIIIPSRVKKSAAFKEYEFLLGQQIELNEKVAKLSAAASDADSRKASLSLDSLSLLNNLLQKELPKAEESSELVYAQDEKRNLDRTVALKAAEIQGVLVNKHEANDLVVYIFENLRWNSEAKDLVAQKRIAPIVEAIENDSIQELNLVGYGRTSILSQFSVKSAERKITQNTSVSVENVDPSFIVTRGLFRDVNSEKYKLGKNGVMLEGDYGGAVFSGDSLVSIYSHYNLTEKEGELAPAWPHYYKSTNKSEFVEMYSIRVDSPVSKELFAEDKQEGADIIYKDAQSGKIYRN